MPVFISILIFFITACGPQEEPPESKEDKAKANQEQVSTTTQTAPKEENIETLPPSPSSSGLQPAENPNPQNQDTVLPNNDNTDPNSLQEAGSFLVQPFLNQIKGVYQFPLDVYQSLLPWTTFYDDALVTASLAPNPRPQAEQLLIEAVSPQDPFGKFCVVQSNFNAPPSDKDATIEALHSISNDGNIEDIDDVKNTLEINTDEPLSFILEFYGSKGAESVEFNTEDAVNDENITLDFDSLCRSCGFEIGQDGLCQQKAQNILEGET